MTSSTADTDLRVRQHFDHQADLYTDVHRPKHISICRERIRLLKQEAPIASGEPRLLDIGCGAGYLADEFLRQYPKGRALGFDLSTEMLSRNALMGNKVLFVADARAIPLRGVQFDLINFDAVLHHVIDGRGYRATIQGVTELLASLRAQLTPTGTIMIREIYHEMWLWKSLGCRLVHMVSSTQLPGFMAGILRAIGIKTANVGVCFLTRDQWQKVFLNSGLEVVSKRDERWPSPLRFLGFRNSGEVYYFLKVAASRDAC
ncbi:MAG TPA: methyltransferase domain-containing protein [Bryobacteraceae bacterium]|nr:methyltransferase domain-containing protein [Bryobacteraceae bacterium]